MKRLGHLYETMLDMNNIMSCYKEVMRNTHNKKAVARYEDFKAANLNKIYTILKEKKYKVKKYNIFTIHEPKTRVIVSLGLTDKIINHLVTRCILMPALIKALIDQNVATRPGKGTSAGIKLYKKYRQSCNYKYDKYYILKGDITKYFHSINHDIVKDQLRRRIKDEDALKIVDTIIDSYPYGLPIGNMSSQILAIYYLNPMDRYIKETLKIKYYVRYQDDFLLFHPSKEYLKECEEKIRTFLKEELDLELNHKSRIYSNKEKLVFIGYNKGKGVARKKLAIRKRQYNKGYISLNSYISSIMSYKGRV